MSNFSKAYENYFKESILIENFLGKWRVVWRSFDTVKQEHYFADAKQAGFFLANLKRRDIRPEIDELQARGELDDAVNFWAGLR